LGIGGFSQGQVGRLVGGERMPLDEVDNDQPAERIGLDRFDSELLQFARG